MEQPHGSSEPASAHGSPPSLDDLLEKEGIVATLRERIANLEEFRKLYWSLKAEHVLTNNSAQASPGAKSTEYSDSKTSAEVEAKLQQQNAIIDTLQRQIKELNGCQQVLESEIDRLAEENEHLRNNSSGGPPAPAIGTPAAASPNPESSNPEETIAELRREVTQTMEMAFNAMRSNADLGGVIHLLTQSFECSSTKALILTRYCPLPHKSERIGLS